ncbi:MAG: immunoglobulin domain-containing protein [Verrucomicrobiota bacterium]
MKTLTAFIGIFALSWCVHAQNFSIDQSYLPRVSLESNIGAETLWGQTFTVSRTGIVSRADLLIYRGGLFSNVLRVTLVRMKGPSLERVMAEVEVPAAQIPGTLLNPPQILTVHFSTNTTVLLPGDSAALIVSAPSANNNPARVAWGAGCNGNEFIQCGGPGTSDGYAGGKPFFAENLQTAPTFLDGWDFGFQIWMDPPVSVLPPDEQWVLDQQYSPRLSLEVQTRFDTFIGQTFVVGQTGIVRRVELVVYREGDFREALTVSLSKVEGGALLPPFATVQIPNDRIPPALMHPPSYLLAEFPTNEFAVRPGDALAVVIWAGNTNSFSGRAAWAGGCEGGSIINCGGPGTSDGYPSGKPFYTSSLTNAPIFFEGWDFSFRVVLGPIPPPPPPPLPPKILSEPIDLTVAEGEQAVFEVAAQGVNPAYRWFKNSRAIPGATSSRLIISSARLSDAGGYSAAVVFPQGSYLTRDAKLTVVPKGSPIVSTLAGSGLPGKLDSESPLRARFTFPNSPAVSQTGYIFVADTGNHSIRIIAPEGTVSTLAGRGEPGYLNGTADIALLQNPLAVALDRAGDVFVADTDNNVLRKIITSSYRNVITFAGSGVRGQSDGSGAAVRFDYPNDLVLDAGGNIYVSEFNAHTIRKITPHGVTTTIAGSGRPGFKDGPALEAEFNRPAGIGLDRTGNLYVTEWLNHTVRKISPDGRVTTLAGSANAPGLKNGRGNEARFHTPDGICADPDGNLYVTEYGNHTIRKITPDGMVTTFAGRGFPGYADGAPDAALFRHPGGVAWHPNEWLIISDTGNHRIRKIDLKAGRTNLAPIEPFLVLDLRPTLTLFGRVGQEYRIEFNEEANPAQWLPLVEIKLTNSWQVWTDPRPASPTRRFYRAVVKE